MDPGLSSLNDIRRGELGKPFEPEADCFRFTVPELPGLQGLGRLTDHRAKDAHRIFESNPGDGGSEQGTDETDSFQLLGLFVLKPPSPAYRKVRAGGVRDHKIPTPPQDVTHVPEVMRPGPFRGDKVGAHCLMAGLEECIPDNAREFTGDKYPHGIAHPRNHPREKPAMNTPIRINRPSHHPE